MTILPHVDRSPTAMTRRARTYLLIGGLRHLVIGGFMLSLPGQFKAAAFIPIVGAAPLWMWSGTFLLTAVLCVLGSAVRNRDTARIGLIASAATSGIMAMGLILGAFNQWMHGLPATPITAVLLASLTAKDLVMCTQPMRTPFEEMLFEPPPFRASPPPFDLYPREAGADGASDGAQ